MKMKKVVLSAVCAGALVVGTIAGTMAYLTDATNVVTNTFTVGNITATLDETDVDIYGVKDGQTRVVTNEYKLIPGHTYVKDPIVHVQEGSEPCYVFVKITDPLANIELAGSTIDDQMKAGGWEVITKNGETFYGKNVIVDARTAAQDVPTFANLVIASNAEVSDLGDIVVVACAVQSDGVTYEQAQGLAVWA